MIGSRARHTLEMPWSGRVMREIGDPAIREQVVGSYRLIYRVSEGTIEVLRVLHGRQLITPDRVRERAAAYG